MATTSIAGSVTSTPADTPHNSAGVPNQVPPPYVDISRARAAALDHAGREIAALAQAAILACKNPGAVTEPELMAASVMPRIELLGTCVGVLADERIDADEVLGQYGLIMGGSGSISLAVDDDQRPEAVVGAAKQAFTRKIKSRAELLRARDQAIYYAAAESAAIANMLRAQDRDSGEFEFLLPGALMRIEALCAAACILQGKEDQDEIAEEYEIVFGEKLESDHA